MCEYLLLPVPIIADRLKKPKKQYPIVVFELRTNIYINDAIL